MHLLQHTFNRLDALLQPLLQSFSATHLEGRLQVHFGGRQTLAYFVVQFACDALALSHARPGGRVFRKWLDALQQYRPARTQTDALSTLYSSSRFFLISLSAMSRESVVLLSDAAGSFCR